MEQHQIINDLIDFEKLSISYKNDKSQTEKLEAIKELIDKYKESPEVTKLQGDVLYNKFKNETSSLDILLPNMQNTKYAQERTDAMDTALDYIFEEKENRERLNSIASEQDTKIVEKIDAEIKNFEIKSEKFTNDEYFGIQFDFFGSDQEIASLDNALNESGIDNLTVNDELLKNAKSGEDLDIKISASSINQELLSSLNIPFEKVDDDKISFKAKLVAQEGFEIEKTKEKKKLLEDNGITFMEHPNNANKFFVPLRGKKVMTLMALSAVMTPLPALAVQIILNQTGVLDKLLEMRRINTEQKRALDEGLTIRAIQKVNGKDREQFLFKDPTTGNINKINVEDLRIDKNQFRGVALSPAQRNGLMSGDVVYLNNPNGLDIAIRLDANMPEGVKEYFKDEMTNKFYEFPTINSANDEKLRYITARGSKGVDEIFKGETGQDAKMEFLELFDLFKDYKAIQDGEKQGLKNGGNKESILNSVSIFEGNLKEGSKQQLAKMFVSSATKIKI